MSWNLEVGIERKLPHLKMWLLVKQTSYFKKLGHLYLSIEKVSCFFVLPPSHGLFKREIFNAIKLLSIKTSAYFSSSKSSNSSTYSSWMALSRNNVHILETQGLEHMQSQQALWISKTWTWGWKKINLDPQSNDKIHKRIILRDCFPICSHCHL